MGALVQALLDGGALQIGVMVVGYLLIRRDIKRLEARMDAHDQRCREKWTRNWAEHHEMTRSIALGEGRAEGRRESV